MIIALLVLLLVLTAIVGSRATQKPAARVWLQVFLITLAQVALIVAFMYFFRTPPTL
jgi:hypothetical protein